MKIRQDFVTNSSSTSFGAAAVTGFATAVASVVGISSAMAAANAAADLPEGEIPGSRSVPNRDLDPDAFINSDASIASKLAQLDHEIGEYQKEWERTKDTLEGADYEKTKTEYDGYIEYLGQKKHEAEEIEFEKQVERLTREAEVEARAEQKQDWIDRRKDDLKNTREQIEMIEASIKGYGGAGYDIAEAKSQLKMFKDREKDLDKTLKKEGVDYDYTAEKREPIGPSKSITESLKKVDEKYDEIFEQLKTQRINRKKKEIIKRNMDAWRDVSKANIKYGNTADKYLKTAETIQVAADVGVDVLEKVTGPVGKTIKKAYVFGKGVGGGVGEAWADPSNATSHILKGTVKGVADLAKEGRSQLLKDGIGIVSETTQGAIGSYQKGESIGKGMMDGVKKAGVDIVVDRVLNKIMPGGDDKGIPDFGYSSGKEIFKGIIKGDPSIRSVFKDSVKDAIKANAINHGKNIPKGDGFIYGDLKLS